MNVGIDVSSLVYGRGVSHYTSNLVRSLLSKPIQVSLYGSSLRQRKNLLRLISEMSAGRKLEKIVVQPYPPSLLSFLWQYGLNPVGKRLPKVEVFHSWDYLQPPDSKLPLVSTIHDLAMLKFPQTAHPKILKMHQNSWKILKQRQAQIITPSHSTRRDVIELLNIDPKMVHVIYEALPFETKVATQKMSEEKYQVIAQRMKLDKPFIFFVGTREPRKNLDRLIQAWQPLSRDFQLLIAGAEGWDVKNSNKTSAKVSSENLRFLGRVSDDELVVLYGEASSFVYPSLDEGFGLPILEAFHHGTPVVTSNISAMTEVAGNAAELVDPLSVEDITRGITKILSENTEKQRQRLQKMIIRLQLFDWSRVASQTIDIYQKAIDNK